jgi:hypothetical protein
LALNGNDTIEFNFFGYNPFVYIRPDDARKTISIRLFPEYRPRVFSGVPLKLKRHKIVVGKARFLKTD